MAVKYSNSAATTLTAGITDSATSFDLDDVSELPALGSGDHMYLAIMEGSNVEVIRVTDVTGSTITCTRGEDNTTAVAASLGAAVELRLCVAMLEDAFADSSAAMRWKENVLLATTANITLSGEQTIDGTLTSANRVLVKDQSSAYKNGIYLTGAGAWTRVTDADAWSELINAVVVVEKGTVNGDTVYQCTADTGGTLETTAITWEVLAGGAGYSSSSSPTVNDDAANTSGNGTFVPSNVWVNLTLNKVFICVDSTATAAIWSEVNKTKRHESFNGGTDTFVIAEDAIVKEMIDIHIEGIYQPNSFITSYTAGTLTIVVDTSIHAGTDIVDIDYWTI